MGKMFNRAKRAHNDRHIQQRPIEENQERKETNHLRTHLPLRCGRVHSNDASKARSVTKYYGTILWYYFKVGAEIVPPDSLCNRNKKSLIVLFWGGSLTCVVTSDHKQRKEPCHNMCHHQFLAGNGCVAASGGGGGGGSGGGGGGGGGEAMVVEIMAETEAAVGAYNNQP
jgi:hypothetical protein